MIKSLNFKIFVGEKLAFNGVIIERNDNTYGLIIDKSVRLNRVYQNTFFLILEGRYKLDFINKKEFEEKKSTIDCKVETIKIDEKTPFDNINKYIEIFGDKNLKTEVYNFELKVNINDEVDKLCKTFGEEEKELIFIPYKKGELLDEECKLIADKYIGNITLKNIIEKIKKEDYAEAILEIESANKINFQDLSIQALEILENIRNNFSKLNLIPSSNKVRFALNNKCIQTVVYLQKTVELKESIENNIKNFNEIKNSNFSNIDDSNINVAKVMENILSNKEVNNFKFSYRDNETLETNLFEIVKDEKKIETLKKNIKSYEDSKKIKRFEDIVIFYVCNPKHYTFKGFNKDLTIADRLDFYLDKSDENFRLLKEIKKREISDNIEEIENNFDKYKRHTLKISGTYTSTYKVKIEEIEFVGNKFESKILPIEIDIEGMGFDGIDNKFNKITFVVEDKDITYLKEIKREFNLNEMNEIFNTKNKKLFDNQNLLNIKGEYIDMSNSVRIISIDFKQKL